MHTKSSMYKWKLNVPMTIGILAGSLSAIVQELRAFCWRHNIEFRYEKSGILVRNVEFYFSGVHPYSVAMDIVESLKDWFRSIETC